jgi:hypothetical protein
MVERLGHQWRSGTPQGRRPNPEAVKNSRFTRKNKCDLSELEFTNNNLDSARKNGVAQPKERGV